MGAHTITAAFSGGTDYLDSQSGPIQQVVNPDATRAGLTALAVRNRRGRIIAVNLDASVQAVSPGSGIPTGPVSFFLGKKKIGAGTLSDGTFVLAAKPAQVMNHRVTAQYAGDGDFQSSGSPSLLINGNSTKAKARPFHAFVTRSHGPGARSMSRHASHGRGI